MKKYWKFIFAILILFSVTFVMPNHVLAENDNFNWEQFEDKHDGRAERAAKYTMSTVIEVIQIVGTAISIMALTYIGMRYMMAAPDEKAEFKKSAYIYIVGAIMVFASSNILAIIFSFAEGIAEI